MERIIKVTANLQLSKLETLSENSLFNANDLDTYIHTYIHTYIYIYIIYTHTHTPRSSLYCSRTPHITHTSTRPRATCCASNTASASSRNATRPSLSMNWLHTIRPSANSTLSSSQCCRSSYTNYTVNKRKFSCKFTTGSAEIAGCNEIGNCIAYFDAALNKLVSSGLNVACLWSPSVHVFLRYI